MSTTPDSTSHDGMAGRMAAAFIDSKLTPLVILGARCCSGCSPRCMLPREEEPQIKVPMIDVMVSMPGATSPRRSPSASPGRWKSCCGKSTGVEYVYSTSSPGESLVIVRFLVGHDVETALVRLNQKLQQNLDRIPPGVTAPLIKARSIDDVPILALTLA